MLARDLLELVILAIWHGSSLVEIGATIALQALALGAFLSTLGPKIGIAS